MIRIAAVAGALFAACGLASAARAQTMVESPQAQVRLIAERTTVAAGETLWLGLNLKMKPGWHTYWRTPGDSGLPARIAWTLPSGFAAGEIQWPPPERVPTGDLMNFGYEGEVTLVVPMTVSASPGTAELVADATWLVCADVCIPEDGHFALPVTVAAAAGRLTDDAPLIAAARASVPGPAPWPVRVRRSGDRFVLSAGPGLPAGIKDAAFFPDGDGAIANAAPQEFKSTGDGISLAVPVGANPPARLSGVLVLGGEKPAGFEIGADVMADAGGDGAMGIVVALLFAVLGGLILNVMPCVLPVLVMKALNMIARKEDAAHMRRDALVYTAGVIAAFTALVGMLLGLRAAGAAVGWGFQLQNPVVVTVLANVMLALGLSLSGVFVIGGSIAGVGQGLAGRSGGWGAFFTGVLAVVVATPCTAPFMGVALGYALTQSPAVAVAVFEGLALGLALPYLAIAFVPGLARLLPRPGLWMERIKQVLAFALYGAAAWLVWVVSQQVDPSGLALAFASLIAVAFAAWSWGLTAAAPHPRRWAATAILAVLVAAATIGAVGGQGGLAPSKANSADAQPYSAARLAELRAAGKPVLVNFTAAWCITCMVNERVALSTPTVKKAIADAGVTYLKGDWTNRNPEITAALHELGRDGVPVYVLYPAKGPPRLLPQVLTPALVVEVLASG
jgi:thiol:disulfide interchange protein DsbD